MHAQGDTLKFKIFDEVKTTLGTLSILFSGYSMRLICNAHRCNACSGEDGSSRLRAQERYSERIAAILAQRA